MLYFSETQKHEKSAIPYTLNLLYGVSEVFDTRVCFCLFFFVLFSEAQLHRLRCGHLFFSKDFLVSQLTALGSPAGTKESQIRV